MKNNQKEEEKRKRKNERKKCLKRMKINEIDNQKKER